MLSIYVENSTGEPLTGFNLAAICVQSWYVCWMSLLDMMVTKQLAIALY